MSVVIYQVHFTLSASGVFVCSLLPLFGQAAAKDRRGREDAQWSLCGSWHCKMLSCTNLVASSSLLLFPTYTTIALLHLLYMSFFHFFVDFRFSLNSFSSFLCKKN